MARDFDGSTDRIDYANIMNWTEQAQTISMWVYLDDIASTQYLLTDQITGDGDLGGCFIRLADPGYIGFWQPMVGGWHWRDSDDDTFSANAWFHLLITWDGSILAATGIHIYLNNSEVSYQTTTIGTQEALAGTGSHALGGRIFDDAANLDGRLAAIGRWNRVLSAGEIAALAVGYSPLFFLNSLKWAPDLIRGVNDPISGKTGTLDGTTVIAHPRIIRPAISYYSITISAAEGRVTKNTRAFPLGETHGMPLGF